MAASAPRVATANAFGSYAAAFECAVFLHGFHSILRTGGQITTARRNHGTERGLIKADKFDHNGLQHGFRLPENQQQSQW